MNIAIIGCGLIGEKRAKAIGSEHRLAFVSDVEYARAERLSQLRPQDQTIPEVDWRQVVYAKHVDLVIVATTNEWLASITLEAVKQGKHVLVEKPAGRHYGELMEIIKLSGENKSKVKVGFNLRYHPGIMEAKRIIDSRVLGEVMFIRGRYGHGGRVGYDREWRADPNVAGGGELLDQGIHLIDLSRWFIGDFREISGFTHTYFWDMPVEDNGFVMLKNDAQQVAWLHASCTEWKNTFSFEIYAQKGKLHIEGLGGSYGVERLYVYRMLPQMGPPDTQIFEYPRGDESWKVELEDFIRSIEFDEKPNGDIVDAYEALKIIDYVYNGDHV